MPRVEAVFLEKEETAVAGDQRGKEMSKVCWGEFVAWLTCFENAWRNGLKGGVGLEGNANTGKNVKAVEEGGIEREAQVGEGAKLGWVVGIACGEHSGGSGGGFGEGNGLIEHGDAGAVVMEFEGEGEANDACPGDADVLIRRRRVLHGTSLERDQGRCTLPRN